MPRAWAAIPILSPFQEFHGKFKPKPILTNAVFFGNLNILEHYRVGVRATHSHFIFVRAKTDSGRIFFHNKNINTTMALVRVCLGNHQVIRSRVGTGDPVFGSVNQIMIVFFFGSGTLHGSVRAGFGFRQKKSTDSLAAGKGF